MPLDRRTGPDGKLVFVRKPFRAADYTVPPDVIPTVRSWDYLHIHDLMDEREGPLHGRYSIVDRYEQGGKKWLVLQNVKEFCLEVEDSYQPIAEIEMRALPPEKAWDYALAEDAKRDVPVEHDGW